MSSQEHFSAPAAEDLPRRPRRLFLERPHWAPALAHAVTTFAFIPKLVVLTDIIFFVLRHCLGYESPFFGTPGPLYGWKNWLVALSIVLLAVRQGLQVAMHPLVAANFASENDVYNIYLFCYFSYIQVDNYFCIGDFYCVVSYYLFLCYTQVCFLSKPDPLAYVYGYVWNFDIDQQTTTSLLSGLSGVLWTRRRQLALGFQFIDVFNLLLFSLFLCWYALCKSFSTFLFSFMAILSLCVVLLGASFLPGNLLISCTFECLASESSSGILRGRRTSLNLSVVLLLILTVQKLLPIAIGTSMLLWPALNTFDTRADSSKATPILMMCFYFIVTPVVINLYSQVDTKALLSEFPIYFDRNAPNI